jgi:hypothetical protein
VLLSFLRESISAIDNDLYQYSINSRIMILSTMLMKIENDFKHDNPKMPTRKGMPKSEASE